MSSESTPAAALDRLVHVMGASIYGPDWRFNDHTRISSARLVEENCRKRLAAVLPALADELQREGGAHPGWAPGWGDHAANYLRSLAAPANDQEAGK
jgi:hypothetical protein